MTKVRQDAWSHEDDLLLAETVLRHIREGSTQLQAFEEVGDKLNRTSAACGFRWNAEVRQNYEQAIQIAKRQRKERKRALAKQNQKQQTATSDNVSTFVDDNKSEFIDVETVDESETFPILNWEQPSESLPIPQEPDEQPVIHSMQQDQPDVQLDQVIQYLQRLKNDQQVMKQSQQQNQALVQEKQQLQEKVTTQEKRIKELQQELTTMKEDYQAFMQIVERARKMVVFDEEDSRPIPKFRMDKNGNLEQVAK
ncbi:RsfA family transcription factor [Gracilibacillus halophilus YIM-C55.5]|uniref:RsfA family transcription factor n=1 Tax=Gracilibacillus halophilus YIM-C55.5 TaxID=1308866 RepID=N4WLR7_9BACI|nr:RsfA family transcriptional regulator [Gracilibacillus halophilus]ENH97082.1 RsfA family transcription factor [Gracilibacillus halophilus YIM-C55.5]